MKVRCIKLSNNKIIGVGQANYEFGKNEIAYNNNIYITRIEGYK